MATGPLGGMIDYLNRATRLHTESDAYLLEEFIARRDSAPLEEIVRRYGPMVWGVCRRIVHDHQDAEDAFQATFLILVRKAPSIVPRAMVANWLYGVAHRTALKARARTAQRKWRERQVAEMTEPVTTTDARNDLLPILDQELSRLPDKYRAVVVLCELQGKTRREVAVQLGCPEGTVAGRLARARKMLADRFARRGITLSGATLGSLISQVAASAVPVPLVAATMQTTTAGVISAPVAALTEGVLKAMFLSKLKMGIAAIAFLGLAFTSGLRLAGQGPTLKPDGPAKEVPMITESGKPGEPPTAKAIPKDAKHIRGTWIVTDLHLRGREATKELKEYYRGGGYKIEITGDAILHMPDKSVGRYQLDTTKTPHVLELVEDDKIVARGIFEQKGDELKLCLGRKEDSGEPEPPKDFDIANAPPGKFPTLFVLKRDKSVDGVERLIAALEGFRTTIPPPIDDLQEGNGQSVKETEPYLLPHLGGVAYRLGVKTKAECLVLLTYLKDPDGKIRWIAIRAIESVVKAYPSGMSIGVLTDTSSDEHRKMVLRFVDLIGKLQ